MGSLFELVLPAESESKLSGIETSSENIVFLPFWTLCEVLADAEYMELQGNV